MKQMIFCGIWCLFGAFLSAQEPFFLASPDSSLQLRVQVFPQLLWQLWHDGSPLSDVNAIGMDFDAPLQPLLQYISRKNIREQAVPQAPTRNQTCTLEARQMTLYFQGDWGVCFRVFNEGMAYRFFTRRQDSLLVLAETFQMRLPHLQTVYFPEEQGFYSHNERMYHRLAPDQLQPQRLASLPLLLQTTDRLYLLLTETNLRQYPGLWVRGDGRGGLYGDFPHYPRNFVELTNRDQKPVDRAPWLGRCPGQHEYPWRVLLLARSPEQLLGNDVLWMLADPAPVQDFSWVKPGKALWDWWTNLNIAGVPFQAGVNQASYLHYIDFAARYHIEYVIMDEGWSETGQLNWIQSDLNMDSLAARARARNVGLVLWVTWRTIEKQWDLFLPQLKKWGIAGLKVDFMQRDDQPAVDFYWELAKKCAENHLLLLFHGAHKPAGLQRTYPNVLSFEGVFGAENDKWDLQKRCDPEHDLTIPFIRMAVGPMDYTPGAMRQALRNEWAPSWNRPASQGTRCHELAKYVVFESPLQMLSDSPSNYEKEPVCWQFLSRVPVVWKKTVPLKGAVGDYLALARQATNGLWYVAAMTDWTARDLELDTRWLPQGEYAVEIFEDGINATRDPQDFRHFCTFIQSGQPLRAPLAPGGGWVAILKQLKH
jgi:alpha-glucosidase